MLKGYGKTVDKRRNPNDTQDTLFHILRVCLIDREARIRDNYNYGILDPFFFFQAEDGIRDLIVTGVQTCALPIWEIRGGKKTFEKQRGGKILWVVGPALVHARAREDMIWFIQNGYVQAFLGGNAVAVGSEERRGGEEGRFRGWADH